MLDIVLEVFRQLTRSSSLKRLLFQLVSTEGDYNFMNINHWKLNVKPERLCFWIPIWFEENTMVVPVYEYKRWENHVAGSRTLLRRASATRILVSNLPFDRNMFSQPAAGKLFLLFARNARQHKMYQSPLSLQIQPCQIYSLLYQSDINLQWQVNIKKLLHFPWKNGSKNVDFCPRLSWTGWNW